MRINFPEKKTTTCTNADPGVDSCALEYELFKLEEGCGEVEIDVEGAEGGYLWGSFAGTLCRGADDETEIEGKFSAYSEE